MQLKATDSLAVLKDGTTIAFAVERVDLEYWLGEWLPVILIVYDAQTDIAYWVYVQAYFQSMVSFDLAKIGGTTTIHLSSVDVVDTRAMRLFAHYKADVLRQRPEVIYYES